MLLLFLIVPLLVGIGLTWYLHGTGWAIALVLLILFILYRWIYGGTDYEDGTYQPSAAGKDYFWLLNARRFHGFYKNGNSFNYNYYQEHYDYFKAKIQTDRASKGKVWRDEKLHEVADYLARLAINRGR